MTLVHYISLEFGWNYGHYIYKLIPTYEQMINCNKIKIVSFWIINIIQNIIK